MTDDLASTFVSDGHGGYLSVCDPFLSCPPYVIADVAATLLTSGLHLEMPGDYNLEILENIKGLTGWRGERVRVTPRQATELRVIGRGIVALADSKALTTPLSYCQRASIELLIRRVTAQ